MIFSGHCLEKPGQRVGCNPRESGGLSQYQREIKTLKEKERIPRLALRNGINMTSVLRDSQQCYFMETLLFSFFLFFFLSFQGHTHAIWIFSDQGSHWSCSHWPMPQPKQCQIQAMSATCTTAHSNGGSLTHGAKPGIEPASSWILVIFVSTEL